MYMLLSLCLTEAWHARILPRWHETWNNHDALAGRDAQLGFVLLTSFVSGNMGTATESKVARQILSWMHSLDTDTDWENQLVHWV